ncbi:MAG: hypothetical protein AAGA54_19385 [Myxococcota bacterium]
MRSRRQHHVLALAFAAAAGCQSVASDAVNAAPGGTTGSGAASSTSSTSGAMPPDLEASSSEGSTSDGFASVSFLDTGDDCGEDCIAEACDLWTQACDAGEKCMSWANDGGSAWNATRCVPVDPEPGAPGEPCRVAGSAVSGVDSCGLGSMCWDVDDQKKGTCISLCGGTPREPLCDDPADRCVQANDGRLTVCVPSCDPLADDCTAGSSCIWIDGGFACIPDAGFGRADAGQPCDFANACAPDLQCVGGVVAACRWDFCRAARCSPTSDPSAACEAGSACVEMQPGLSICDADPSKTPSLPAPYIAAP